MTVMALFDIAVAALLVALAVWTVAARELFSAVVVFVVYGLLLTLAWVRLAAPDVALTEAAIGSGVTGMLLIGAAARLGDAKAGGAMPGLAPRILAGLASALISLGLAAVVLMPAEPAPTLAPEAMAHLHESGLGNPVAGVLFVYRALDTLLEKVVLLLAVIAVWSLAPDRLWGGVPGLRVHAEPNSVLVLLALLLPPLGIVFGVYMGWIGATEPGGAFQGGTVLAAMWILLMIAGLQPVPATDDPRLRLLLVVGPIVFVAVGLAGSVLAGAFLAYPAGYAKPLIVAVEAALIVSIAVTLGLLAAGPPERRAPG